MVIKNKGKDVEIITDVQTYSGGPCMYKFKAKEYTSVHISDKEVVVYDKDDILVYLNREHVASVYFYD